MDNGKDISEPVWNPKPQQRRRCVSDCVEVLYRVEDCFGIKISDKEAQETYTIGELFNLILRKLGQKNNSNNMAQTCLTAKTFYRLRQGLLCFKHCEGMRIRPDTPLDKVLPLTNRRKLWPELAKNIGLKLPQLRRSWEIRFWILIFCIIWIAAGLRIIRSIFPVELFPTPTFETYIAIKLAGLATILILSVILTRPFVRKIPECRNVGDLTRLILWDNHNQISQEAGQKNIDPITLPDSEKQVWNALLYIISDIACLKQTELKPEDQFVKDLNFD